MTRYLDRRRTERGGTWIAARLLIGSGFVSLNLLQL